MQSVVSCLRSRHRSSAVLTALVRLADPAVSVTAHAHSEQAGRSLCFDQRLAPNSRKGDLRSRLVSGDSAKLICHVTSGSHFSSSAEFSAGSFKATATPGEDRQEEEAADDIDDKAMLLEASLSFVVSSLCSWLVGNVVCSTLVELTATCGFLCTQGDKGWTDAALIAGAKHLGLSPAIIGLLPRGPAELVEASHECTVHACCKIVYCQVSCVWIQYFEHKCNEELASQLQNNKEAWQGLRMTQRVKEGLKLRLQMNAPYIGTLNVVVNAISLKLLLHLYAVCRHLGTSYEHQIST